MNHIIVQAGGKGTRLGYLTKNDDSCPYVSRTLSVYFRNFVLEL